VGAKRLAAVEEEGARKRLRGHGAEVLAAEDGTGAVLGSTAEAADRQDTNAEEGNEAREVVGDMDGAGSRHIGTPVEGRGTGIHSAGDLASAACSAARCEAQASWPPFCRRCRHSKNAGNQRSACEATGDGPKKVSQLRRRC
jgi:hypothetical protein